MAPRILLANEGGAGRGHVVTLKTVAEALGDGFSYDAALCRLEYGAELEPFAEKVVRGPTLRYDPRDRIAAGSPGTATWGEFLAECGFRDPAFLRRQLERWQRIIRVRKIKLVVADFAPLATLAARSLGVPVAIIGTGHAVAPPDLDRFPPYLPRHSRLLHDENDLVDALNEAGGPLGVPQLSRLPEIFRCDVPLVCTLGLLDPYRRWRTEPRLPPIGDLAEPTTAAGDEVFIYFSTTERDNAAIMEAISSLGVPTRLFMPGITDELASRFSAAGVIVETRPVPVALLAGRTRLMLNAGQHGILCLGLAAGLPQVALPQHLEHEYHAQRVADAGAAAVLRSVTDAGTIRSSILAAYNDGRMLARARELAVEIRPELRDLHAALRERLLPLLPRRAASRFRHEAAAAG